MTTEENDGEDFEEPSNFGTGMHVITITYHDNPQELPEIDLGDCNPWVATTILKAAIDSIDMMIPPMSVTYKGEIIISHAMSFDDEDFTIDDDEDD